MNPFEGRKRPREGDDAGVGGRQKAHKSEPESLVHKPIQDFLSLLTDNKSTIPDEVLVNELNKAGCKCPDEQVRLLLAVAVHKFIFDIASDALCYCHMQHHYRDSNRLDSKSKKPNAASHALTMTDLKGSLTEHGIPVVKPDYYADSLPLL